MKRTFWRVLIILVAIIRAIFPFLIFSHPFWAIFINLMTDAPDGYISYKAGWRWKTYHVYDKIFDFWWYIFVTLYASRLEVFPIVLVLFALRLIGQTASTFSKNEKYLCFFPNVIEPYFVWYLFFTLYLGLTIPVLSLANLLLLLVSILFALAVEVRIHIKKKYWANTMFKLRILWEANEPVE